MQHAISKDQTLAQAATLASALGQVKSRIREFFNRMNGRGSYEGACFVAFVLRRFSIKAEANRGRFGEANVWIKHGPSGSVSLTVRQRLSGKFSCVETSTGSVTPRGALMDMDRLFDHISTRRVDWTSRGLAQKEAEVLF